MGSLRHSILGGQEFLFVSKAVFGPTEDGAAGGIYRLLGCLVVHLPHCAPVWPSLSW
jgi:hypothetical protein